MTASSVTGIGPGEAGNFQQAPDGGNSRTVFRTLHERHTCPYVARVGEYTTGGGEGDFDARITFDPPLEGDKDNYLVVVTDQSESTHPEVTAKTNDANGNFISFDVSSATGTTTVKWMVFFISQKGFVFTSLE